MENHVLTVDLLGEDHAVLVLPGDAWTVTAVVGRRKEVIGRDQAHARTVARVSGISDGVTFFLLEIGDARILHAPLLIGRVTRDGGAIPYLIDSPSIG